MLRVDLTGGFLGIQTLAPPIRAGASNANLSSIAGLTGNHLAAYSTSMWALRGLTRSTALEPAPAGIRVNCVCPGVVDTEMICAHPAPVQALQSIIPMQRIAASDRIAEAPMFLLGPNASCVTGSDIPVDGGVPGGGTFWPVGRAIGAL